MTATRVDPSTGNLERRASAAHTRVPDAPAGGFMAYDAVVSGARELFFFGGHLAGAMTPRDRVRGWNWTYWRDVQRS